ncbi:hypothetical protein KXW15_006471, partial [Aspergillus fumigatus]
KKQRMEEEQRQAEFRFKLRKFEEAERLAADDGQSHLRKPGNSMSLAILRTWSYNVVACSGTRGIYFRNPKGGK